MTFQTGISLVPLLEQASGLAQPHVLALSGQGIVLFLQAVAYVLVSLAALAVLLRFGLKGIAGHSHGNCKCAGKKHSEASAKGSCGCGESAAAYSSCCGRGSAEVFAAHGSELAGTAHGGELTGAAHSGGTAHGSGDATPHMHHANGCCNADAKAPQGRQVRFDLAQNSPHAAAPSGGEPRSLSRGRLPEQCTLPPVVGTQETDSAAARIQAAANEPAAVAVGTSVAGSAQQAAGDADEQRRITAVIAAAVHNVLGGQPHRIVRIEPVSQGWAQEGRRDIFSSHRIR